MVSLKINQLLRILGMTVLLFTSVYTTIAGGGWTNGQGHGYLKVSQSWIRADRFFAPSGEVVPITTTSFYSTAMYAEYGLGNRLDVITYVPFFVRSTINNLGDQAGNILIPGDDLNGVGDIDLTIKYAIIKDKSWVMAASLTLGIPSGNPRGGNSQSLQTGDGEFNQMLSFDLSRSFGKLYISMLAGYNHRTNNFSDEFRYGAEAGYSSGKMYYIIRLNGIKPLGRDNLTGQDVQGIFGNRIEYLSFTPEVIYQAGKSWGVTAAIGGAFYAKRILAAPNLTVGAYFKF